MEHKLKPWEAGAARQISEQINKARARYLQAMGAAKEAETQLAALDMTLQNVVNIAAHSAALPESPSGWKLTADCSALVGEVAAAPLPPAPAAPPHGAAPLDGTTEVVRLPDGRALKIHGGIVTGIQDHVNGVHHDA